MNKFNVGDTVFDLMFGFGVVEELEDKNPNTHLLVKFHEGDKFDDVAFYLKDGRNDSEDFAPSLLTLEEAAKLGYFPEKKKVKKKYELWINVFRNTRMIIISGLHSTEFTCDVYQDENAAKKWDCESGFHIRDRKFLGTFKFETPEIEVEE